MGTNDSTKVPNRGATMPSSRSGQAPAAARSTERKTFWVPLVYPKIAITAQSKSALRIFPNERVMNAISACRIAIVRSQARARPMPRPAAPQGPPAPRAARAGPFSAGNVDPVRPTGSRPPSGELCLPGRGTRLEWCGLHEQTEAGTERNEHPGVLPDLRQAHRRLRGLAVGLRGRGGPGARLGRDRPVLSLLGHVAAGDQHRHHHRHVPDGVPHAEHPEPGREGDPPQARRAAARREERANGPGAPGRPQRERVGRSRKGVRGSPACASIEPATRAAGVVRRGRRLTPVETALRSFEVERGERIGIFNNTASAIRVRVVTACGTETATSLYPGGRLDVIAGARPVSIYMEEVAGPGLHVVR